MADRLIQTIRDGKIALILCEVQEGVVGSCAPWLQLAEAGQKVDMVHNITRLAACARRHGRPVVHCTAEFLEGRFGANTNARLFGNAKKRVVADQTLFAKPVPGTFVDGDILLPRYHGVSPMTGSPLDSVLRNAGVDTVIVTGVAVSFAITNLTMDAVNRSYQVILPSDGVAGFPEEYASQVIENTLSMLATVASTEEIMSAWESADLN